MTDDARTRLAWLMWCYSEGYRTAKDRATMTNWMLYDADDLHPEDRLTRAHLLVMADEILALVR